MPLDALQINNRPGMLSITVLEGQFFENICCTRISVTLLSHSILTFCYPVMKAFRLLLYHCLGLKALQIEVMVIEDTERSLGGKVSQANLASPSAACVQAV